MRRALDSLLATLAPRLDPEEKPHRLALARAAIRASALILAAWLIVEQILLKLLRPVVDHAWTYDLVAILALAVLLVIAELLLRGEHITVVGYLIAIGSFLYPLINAYLAPWDIYLVNGAFLIPVLAAGVLLGGGPAFLFAAAAIAGNVATWFFARGQPAAQVHPFDPTTGAVFLLVQSLLAMATAAVMNFFSTYMRRSILALNVQADQMTELAHTDPMTGVANRRWLMDQLGREFSRARRYRRPLSVLYLDLDGFKAINDHFGHLFGDEVLAGTAKAMKAVLRSTDLLARIGGDEFVVLLPETGIDGAHNVTAKLRKALAAYGQQLGPAVPTLTFCAGVSQLHPDDTTIDDILARADDAQYLAKGTGPGHTRSEKELVPPPAASEPRGSG